MAQADTLAEPATRRRLLDVAGMLTTPLLPDDYLTLVDPLWSFSELRGRIETIVSRTPDAATITIRPGRHWTRHRAGQHVAIGVDVDGVRHWRSYSLTSDPARADGCISITVKRVTGGVVSSHLVDAARPGDIVRLGPPAGDFGWSDESLEQPILLITAGSGITPVMAMLRDLERREGLHDVVHLHSERSPDHVIFGSALRSLAASNPAVTFVERHTGRAARFAPTELDALCPDWRERQTYACGPLGLLEALETHFDGANLRHRLHVERFQLARVAADPGDGGTVTTTISGRAFEARSGDSLLDAAEAAGLAVRSGCRMGICHSCVCELNAGQVRDLRTGAIHGEPGEHVQLCVSAAAGDLELRL